MDAICVRLKRARRIWRFVDVAGAALRGLAFVLIAFLGTLILDNFLALPGWVRMVFDAAFLGAALYVLFGQVIYRLVRPLTDEMVATHIERACPGLDNRLINAVLLQKEPFEDPVTRRMVASQLGEAAQAVEAIDVSASTNRKALRKWAAWAGALCLATLMYSLVFSQYFANALRRYVSPHKYIAPVTDTILTVSPGSVELLQGESLNVEARVQGVLPEKAQIFFDDGQGGAAHKVMPFEGGCFSYGFTGVQKSFKYRVEAGDAVSDTYGVTVCARPSIREVKLTYVYPAYMGLPEKTESSQVGNISAPVGTQVRLEATSDRPITSARLSVKYLTPAHVRPEGSVSEGYAGAGGDTADSEEIPATVSGDQTLMTQLEVKRSGQYQILVCDKTNIPNQPPLAQLVALPDEAPFVRVVDPGKDIAVEPAAKLTVLAEAKDDFSLHAMTFVIQRGTDKEWEKFRSWDYKQAAPSAPLRTRREVREGAVLDLKELSLAPGTVLSYYFQANDDCPGRDVAAGRSRTYQVTIVDGAAAKQKAEQQQEALKSLIRKLIGLQKSNLAATQDLRAWSQLPPSGEEVAQDGPFDAAQGRPLGPQAWGGPEPGRMGGKARDLFTARASPLVKAEEEIYTGARDAVREFAGLPAPAVSGGMESAEGRMLDVLASIAAGEIARAIGQLEALRNVADKASIPAYAGTAATTEQQVVALLEKLLEDPQKLAAERLEQPKTKEKLSEQAEALTEQKQRAEKMLEAVKKFEEDQREVVKMSNKLAETPVSDFTKGDEKMLEKVLDTELKWAKYFQETATDLSKLPPQDFSLAGMAKEYSEIFSEVQKAAKAAQMKSVEMAVPLEQGGLELAKSIETNIEKWLMEVPDRLAWKMEDAVQDYDVPLADLPDELEDIIGDLMEKEEELMEDAADATSGWLDSIDKGIGWGTMDGPISDMSAKGVTGNVLPDSHEVGGRSGEGRTGKSSGQFVEETATGKGGRNTPTRLTQDAYEAGVVKDTSTEPATGSTGGGKASGVGQEGLHGPMPPPVRQELKRVAQLQQQLIDKASRLDYGLKKYNYPRGELPKTIELMQQMKKNIESGDFSTAGAKQKIVLSNLTEVKDVVSRQKKVNRDNSALLPKELRDEVANSLHEEAPEQYRDLVKSYFQALSEAGSAK